MSRYRRDIKCPLYRTLCHFCALLDTSQIFLTKITNISYQHFLTFLIFFWLWPTFSDFSYLFLTFLIFSRLSLSFADSDQHFLTFLIFFLLSLPFSYFSYLLLTLADLFFFSDICFILTCPKHFSHHHTLSLFSSEISAENLCLFNRLLPPKLQMRSDMFDLHLALICLSLDQKPIFAWMKS